MSDSFRKRSPGAYFNDGYSSMFIQARKEKKPEDVPGLVKAVNAALKTFNRVYDRESKRKQGTPDAR